MEIRELRAFVAVVEAGGLSAAARVLHVSQPALSQTIQSLERQLGAQLLVRDHSGSRPSEVGKVLLGQARAVLARHDEAVRIMAAATGADGGRSGLVRVGLPMELPADLLPDALARLAVSHPGARVQVQHSSSAAQLAALRSGQLDLALVRDRPGDPELDAVLVVEEALGVILPEDRSREVAEGDGVHLHRLVGLEWIGFARSETPAWFDQVVATLRGHGLEAQARHQEHPLTAEVKLAAVGAGRGFALAPPGWPQPLPAGLVWHPLVGSPLVRRTWAVWPAQSRDRDLAALIAALTG